VGHENPLAINFAFPSWFGDRILASGELDEIKPRSIGNARTNTSFCAKTKEMWRCDDEMVTPILRALSPVLSRGEHFLHIDARLLFSVNH
jgi:hypothetical protein